ncbi:MAG: spermidine/putrescine ABC transporter substrate-binding protein PotD, partial [Candidatus Omnitrophica bacterium]|nr:spermidine/putrescine ABC transporter substrate-binding protein PotD [Candidatus Omnitrophota bacterium]
NTFSYPTAVEAEAFIDKENFNNPVIFPPKDVLLRGEFIQDLGESEEEYIMIFNLLKRGKV